ENESQASRVQPSTNAAWMGDVYKVVPVFWQFYDWLPAVLIKDIPPSGIFALRVTPDLHEAITGDYTDITRAMEAVEFAPTIAEMKARAVNPTSGELAAFIEGCMPTSPAGETTATLLIRAMMSP